MKDNHKPEKKPVLAQEYWVCGCPAEFQSLHHKSQRLFLTCGTFKENGKPAELADILAQGLRVCPNILEDRRTQIVLALKPGVPTDAAQELLQELAEIESVIQKGLL